MKITFLLPVPAHKPLGGAKVVYEYANGLSDLGHEVTVVHTLAPTSIERGPLIAALTYLMRGLGFRGGVGPRRWMKVNPKIRIKWVPNLHYRWIPDGDVVVASSWHTAEYACQYPSSCGRKYYFVQDYEFYKSANKNIKDRMAATYRSGFKNLAISPACVGMIQECGGEVFAQLPNGLDHQKFRLINPIDSVERRWIGFPVRKEAFKRTNDAIAACEAIRASPVARDYKYWGFGATKPEGWPEWITFVQRPSDDELIAWYNRSVAFLVPSEYEGWGLPGSEAMCCGAALVSTRNGGVDAYAEHGRNALFVEPGDVKGIAKNVLDLLADMDLRVGLASEAEVSVRQFNWNSSIIKMERSLG